MNKKIADMTDEELEAAIEELRTVPVPAAPSARKPKRLDDAPKRRRSLMDQLDE